MNVSRISIVVSTQAAQFEALAYKGDLETSLGKIAWLGYDGVELAIRDPRLVDAGKLLNILGRQGLQVPAIGTGQAWGEEGLSFTSTDPSIRQSAVERIKSHIALARQLEALVIIGLIRGIKPKDLPRAQAMQYLMESLQRCAEYAAEEGVRMVLEPINRYETDLINSVAEGLELLERIKADNLGLLLDTFHMNIEEEVIEESIRMCGKHIFHFHVADSNRRPPGGGHLDFGKILTALYDTGYQGWISGEFLPYPDADTAAQAGIANLKKLTIST